MKLILCVVAFAVCVVAQSPCTDDVTRSLSTLGTSCSALKGAYGCKQDLGALSAWLNGFLVESVCPVSCDTCPTAAVPPGVPAIPEFNAEQGNPGKVGKLGKLGKLGGNKGKSKGKGKDMKAMMETNPSLETNPSAGSSAESIEWSSYSDEGGWADAPNCIDHMFFIRHFKDKCLTFIKTGQFAKLAKCDYTDVNQFWIFAPGMDGMKSLRPSGSEESLILKPTGKLEKYTDSADPFDGDFITVEPGSPGRVRIVANIPDKKDKTKITKKCLAKGGRMIACSKNKNAPVQNFQLESANLMAEATVNGLYGL